MGKSVKIPPNNPQIESALLGSVLLKPSAIHSVSGLLTPSDFYNLDHQSIFKAMLDAKSNQLTVDIATVHQRCDVPLDTLNTLLDNATTAVNIIDVARQVKELSAQRGVLWAAHHIVDEAYQRQDNISEFLGMAMSRMIDATTKNVGSDPKHVKTNIGEITKGAIEGRPSIARALTGVGKFDYKIGGLPVGVMTVLGGRPSMGKSSVALCMAAIASQKGPVLYFTLEDTLEAMQARLISNISGVPYFDILGGKVEADRWADITLGEARARQLNLYFECSRLNADEIAQKSLAFEAAHKGTRLIVIDHLGFVSDTKAQRTQPKYERVSAKARVIAELAKSMNCPILLLSQLNRSLEQRPIDQRRPQMSDLRDSGTIEEDARMVIFAYRHAAYDDDYDKGELELIVTKNTSGPVGTVVTRFDLPCCRFIDDGGY